MIPKILSWRAKAASRGARLGFLSAATTVMLLVIPVMPAAFADSYLFDDVEKSVLSLGGRATYFDPHDFSPKWYGGAQARLHFGQMFAIEGSVDYREKKLDSTFTRTYPVQVSALIYLLPGKRVSPFLLGGGGWYYTNVNGPGGFSDTQNRFGAHVGGGLQWMLSQRWSIDGTYRHVWLETLDSKDQNIKDKSFNDNGHMVTIGLNFHF
jgi:opacity protein-like surface antigen